MDDRQFKGLLDDLGYSYEGYRRVRKGVKKRLRRHMSALGCRDAAGYRARIVASREVRAACVRRMAVPISRFMRDRPLWVALGDVWLPELRRRFGPHLRAWSAGCGCGEEAYSLAMIDRESRMGRAPAGALPLAISATDLNPVVLAKARQGIYPASSLREMPPDLAARYFDPLGGGRRYRIRAALLANIAWHRREIECPLLQGQYHLVLLRNNVLTYFAEKRQRSALAQVIERLRPDGLLVVGLGETLPAGVAGVRLVSDPIPHLFEKIPVHGR